MSKKRTTWTDPIPLHQRPPETDFTDPTSQPRPIPGFTGHRQGDICHEIVRKPFPSTMEESILRQELSVNSTTSIKVGYDFSTYAPPRWGSSTSQSALSESAKMARKPRFQHSERAFRRNSSDLVKHGMLSLKNSKKTNNDSVILKKKTADSVRNVPGNWH
jgi:hypothetical protein